MMSETGGVFKGRIRLRSAGSGICAGKRMLRRDGRSFFLFSPEATLVLWFRPIKTAGMYPAVVFITKSEEL